MTWLGNYTRQGQDHKEVCRTSSKPLLNSWLGWGITLGKDKITKKFVGHLHSLWPNQTAPMVKYPLYLGCWAWSAEGSLKQWLQNGKLLLLSLTKCHGVPCSLPSRITAKVLRNCKTFSSRPRPRPRPNVQDQDQDFVIQDQDSFLSSRRLETKTLSRGLTSLENYTWNIAYRWWNLGKVNWWHTFEFLCIHSYHTFMCYRQQRIT